MKRLRRLGIVAVGLAASMLGFAQQPTTGSTHTLSFENGTIANGAYSNECFGFSLPIPAGWEVNESVTPGGKARHRSDKSLALLFLHQGKLPGGVILSAWGADGQFSSARDFVSNAVHEQINISVEHRELVRETSAVDYGGRHFFRSDYKTALRDSTPLYMSYVYTEFRGYFIGATIASASPEGLDRAANFLQAISFGEDQVNSKCAMSADSGPTWPMQLAQGVSSGLLIKKVPPDYPEIARQARIQGQVVLRAVIDKNGDIKDLTLVSGHAMLAPAAVEAVKQWKYRPYIFQGQPVEVETEIVVNFSLSGGR